MSSFYTCQDDLTGMIMDRSTGIGYALVDAFNQYREGDKIVQRIMVETFNIYVIEAVTLRVYTPTGNVMTEGPVVERYPLRATITGFTALGVNLGAGIRQSSIADYIPPSPLLVAQTEQLAAVAYYDTDGGAGLLSAPIRVTTIFQYVSRDGVPPDRLYQGR